MSVGQGYWFEKVKVEAKAISKRQFYDIIFYCFRMTLLHFLKFLLPFSFTNKKTNKAFKIKQFRWRRSVQSSRYSIPAPIRWQPFHFRCLGLRSQIVHLRRRRDQRLDRDNPIGCQICSSRRHELDGLDSLGLRLGDLANSRKWRLSDKKFRSLLSAGQISTDI